MVQSRVDFPFEHNQEQHLDFEARTSVFQKKIVVMEIQKSQISLNAYREFCRKQDAQNYEGLQQKTSSPFFVYEPDNRGNFSWSSCIFFSFMQR